MAERSRVHLKQEFRDGERPTGADFADLIDSFIGKIDDSINIDPNGNLNIPGGVNLGNAALGNVGTIRFNGGNVQVFDGGTWNNIGGGGGGAFTPVAGGPHVAFGGGNVGIGPFAVPPTFKLEVELGNNSGPDQRVKFGNAVISNGQGVSQSAAQFSHNDQATGNSNFALRQGPLGDVNLNAPTNQPIMISHNRVSPRIFVAPAGAVVIGSNALLAGATAAHILQVNADAAKTQGGASWTVLSDIRLKKDIRPFEDGLDKLMEVKPVSFRYNGLLNTDPNKEEVGVIGQDIKLLFPYMINGEIEERDKNKIPKQGDEVLTYNNSALTYVMVNAIQELNQKVKDLEAKLNAIINPEATA